MYIPHYLPRLRCLLFAEAPPAPDLPDQGNRLFVCGALQDPERMEALIGRRAAFAPALVRGYRHTVERVGEQQVPFMVPDPFSSPSPLLGVLYLGLDDAELEAVAELESAGGLRTRIHLEVRLGDLDLWAYSWVKRGRRGDD